MRASILLFLALACGCYQAQVGEASAALAGDASVLAGDAALDAGQPADAAPAAVRTIAVGVAGAYAINMHRVATHALQAGPGGAMAVLDVPIPSGATVHGFTVYVAPFGGRWYTAWLVEVDMATGDRHDFGPQWITGTKRSATSPYFEAPLRPGHRLQLEFETGTQHHILYGAEVAYSDPRTVR